MTDVELQLALALGVQLLEVSSSHGNSFQSYSPLCIRKQRDILVTLQISCGTSWSNGHWVKSLSS